MTQKRDPEKYQNITLTRDILPKIHKLQEVLAVELGFTPTISQTVAHVLKKYLEKAK